ncbi:MAG: peptidoglycan-binding protein [Bifidobacteriaceae bacterium]|jgi:peptidoglycan hydrolase-like protein with peptidoglycan-binding domain|nr:peptidoglycan-binding protein [Bifidobacteriaceae bacterium]
MTHSGLTSILAATIATVATVAAFVWVYLVGRPLPLEVAPPSEWAYAVAEETSFDYGQAAVLSGDIAAGAEVLAPVGDDGLVTSVFVATGDVLAQAGRVYAVDGRPVFACVSESPLFRSLQRGDKGSDVAAVQAFLAFYSGVDLPVSGTFDVQTERLAQAWQKAEGLGDTGVVEPGSFVWIEAPVTVATVNLREGRPVPGTGEVIIAGASQLGSVSVRNVRPELLNLANEFLFRVNGVEVALGYQEGAWTAKEPTQLLGLLQEAAAAAGQGAASADGNGADSGGASTGGPVIDLDGQIALAEPIDVAAVPASALVEGRDVGSCVFARSAGREVAVTAVPVEFLGVAASGAAMVSAPGLAGQEVLLDAQSAEGLPECA